MTVVDLTRALLRCRSVTPDDAGAIDVVAQTLASAGFVIHRQVFSEPGTPDIVNLYARIGTASPVMLFAGHTDVVPPGDTAAWRFDPFAGTLADGFVWGRGAVDMKGGIAAFVAATLAFLGAGQPAGSIAFLITGDEEGPAVNGTPKLLDWAQARGEHFDACILGEPTNPDQLGTMAKIGRRGSLSGTVVVPGRQGHVAYPHLADNPIPTLARLVAALADEAIDDGTAHFDPSSLQWTTLDVGNPSPNVIPAEASGRFNIRFNDLWTAETLAAEIRARIARAAPQAVVSFAPSNAPAFLTAPGAFTTLMADAIESVTGRRPALSTTGGTSDARFIKDVCPVVEFGLVGQTMHAIDERVAVADLQALQAIYESAITRFFAASSSPS